MCYHVYTTVRASHCSPRGVHNNRVHQNVSLHVSFLIFYGSLIGCIILLPQEVGVLYCISIVIGYKNTISGGSSIMQPIRIPENTRNVILLMNLISFV